MVAVSLCENDLFSCLRPVKCNAKKMIEKLLYILILGSCKSLAALFPDCLYDYTSEGEDTTTLSLPGWKRLPYNTSWPKALQLCPKPWRYRTSEELDNGRIMGTYNTYEGGGYVAVLGYDVETGRSVLGETFGHGWVDRQTRAVILEFAVFNVNTNLLSIATYFYEVLSTGAAYTTRTVETLDLQSTESGAQMFFLICQFLFMAMVCYYLIIMFYNFHRRRLSFFKSVWNMVDFFMIIFSVLAVVFYVIRSKTLLKSIKSIQNNPYDIVHFHSSLTWASWENVANACAIFMVTVKLLNLIRFNPYVIYLFSSFRQSVGYQLSYVFIFLIMFNGFVISGKQFFGHTVLEYSSYLQAVISQFEFLLGKAVPLDDLRREHQILGPLFVFIYMTIMTIVLMNMLVSILNESYIDAKTYVEESAEELEIARFISERFEEMLRGNRKRPEFKLYCDEATYFNMCQSEAEPNCLNSRSIIKCTEDRLKMVEKRLSALTGKAEKMTDDNELEETEFLNLLQLVANHDG